MNNRVGQKNVAKLILFKEIDVAVEVFINAWTLLLCEMGNGKIVRNKIIFIMLSYFTMKNIHLPFANLFGNLASKNCYHFITQ